MAAPGPAAVDLTDHRAELRAYADRLTERELSGLERFASFVQHAADRAVERVGPDAADRASVRAFLDDLVDLFVSSEHAQLKRLVMVSPSVAGDPPLHEDSLGTDGFDSRFRRGEGVFRHFAMSSGASYVYPPLWVDLVARRVGGDLFPEPGTDGASDVAVNAVGREFGLWLRTVDPVLFADGESVAAWIRSRFGETVP